MPFPQRPHTHIQSAVDSCPTVSHSFYSNLLINRHSNDSIFPLPYVLRTLNGSLFISCPDERQLVRDHPSFLSTAYVLGLGSFVGQ